MKTLLICLIGEIFTTSPFYCKSSPSYLPIIFPPHLHDPFDISIIGGLIFPFTLVPLLDFPFFGVKAPLRDFLILLAPFPVGPNPFFFPKAIKAHLGLSWPV